MNGPVLGLKVEETADREEFRRAVLDGLSARPRALPAKFLYDARGSALFDEICELPEYYLTRTETAILKQRAVEIGRRAGPGCALVEFGSGSSVKSRLLIEALPKLALYAPIDISREHLDATAAQLRRDYPRLKVEPVCADFMGPVPPIESKGRRLGFFPGSTIGNLTPEEATAFLRNVRGLVGDDGALVLGADLKKDPRRLHDAYNDSAGVTAAFTLNLLRRMNRELQANFDLSAFAHEAFYDEAKGRIEIYFRSLEQQTVTVAGQRFEFAAGERVHTEYSYKYDAA
ncbi:MAG TPA: L-histidine N(alpha)-methyltransferase, partial [Reyranella sp.]